MEGLVVFREDERVVCERNVESRLLGSEGSWGSPKRLQNLPSSCSPLPTPNPLISQEAIPKLISQQR